MSQKQNPALRIKGWLKETLETATNHFRGILGDEDIGDILRELKSDHQAQFLNNNNNGEFSNSAFNNKISEHLDNFMGDLAEIDNEWNATKEHQ